MAPKSLWSHTSIYLMLLPLNVLYIARLVSSHSRSISLSLTHHPKAGHRNRQRFPGNVALFNFTNRNQSISSSLIWHGRVNV